MTLTTVYVKIVVPDGNAGSDFDGTMRAAGDGTVQPEERQYGSEEASFHVSHLSKPVYFVLQSQSSESS